MRHRPKDPLKLFEIRPPITYSRMRETSLYASKTAITARFVASSSFLTTSDRPTVQTSVQAARKQSSLPPSTPTSAELNFRIRRTFKRTLRRTLHWVWKNEKYIIDGHLNGHFRSSFYGICLGVWVEIPPFTAVLSGFAGGGMTTTRHSIHIYNTRMYNGLPLLRSVGCPEKCVCGIRKRSFMRF